MIRPFRVAFSTATGGRSRGPPRPPCGPSGGRGLDGTPWRWYRSWLRKRQCHSIRPHPEEPAFAKASAGRLDLSAEARRAKAEGRGRPRRRRASRAAILRDARLRRASQDEAECVSSLLLAPYSPAATGSGLARTCRSFFKSSASRKARSIDCSALSRGSQNV